MALLPSAGRESRAFTQLEARLGRQKKAPEPAAASTPERSFFSGARAAWRWRLGVGAVASTLLGFSGAWWLSHGAPTLPSKELAVEPATLPGTSPAGPSLAARGVTADGTSARHTAGAPAAARRARLVPQAAPVRLLEGATELEGEAVVDVAGASQVTAQASRERVQVVVDEGRVALQVRHRVSGDKAFSVTAGAFEFRVLGTVFEVERRAQPLSAAVGLQVKEGLVAVVRDGRIVAKVGAGQGWSGTSPALGSAHAPSAAAGFAGEEGRLALRDRGLVAKHSPRRSASAPVVVAAPRAAVAAAPRAAVAAALPQETPGDASPGQTPNAAADDRAAPGGMSRRGPCLVLETAGRTKDAVTCYEDLGRGPGVGAQASLYQAALLRRDGLHDVAGALASFREYQQRFPQGMLAVEVGLSVAELLPRLGRYDEALAETDRLFARGAGRERRTELLLLRGRILFEGKKDNERAEASFAEAAAGTGRAAVEAVYFRGLCLQKLGRSDEARVALLSYVARGRSASHVRDAKLRLGLANVP